MRSFLNFLGRAIASLITTFVVLFIGAIVFLFILLGVKIFLTCVLVLLVAVFFFLIYSAIFGDYDE